MTSGRGSGPHRKLVVWGLLCLATVLLSPPRPTAVAADIVSNRAPEQLWGGFLRFTFSPACIHALVRSAIACSQVGPAGLAGCGVFLHHAQGACP